MDVAIVAPCPVPLQLGGAENLWRGLQDHLNEETPHQAEILKLPVPERTFWEVVDGYRRFAGLDVAGFDVVVTGKYPAWMVAHPRHVAYMLHPLRGLYDTYHFFGLPETVPDPPPAVGDLLRFLDDHAGRRDALAECFARLDALRDGERSLPPELFAHPGPLLRRLVHWWDGIALAPEAIARHGAISATVRDRPGYFPPGAGVFVAHPPTKVPERRGRDRGYLFTASRLDPPKRIDLLIEAVRSLDRPVELRVAGSGPEAARLTESAGGDTRIRLLGRVPEDELSALYAGARAVAFLPYAEDYGYVTLEAMRAGKPVLTTADAGGAAELVGDGVTGLVVAPDAASIAAGIDRLWSDRGLRRRMGRAARERARAVSWSAVVRVLEDVAG